MKITLVTLYRDGVCEHFVAAVKGTLLPNQRLILAEKVGLKSDDMPDALFFNEMTVLEDFETLVKLGDDPKADPFEELGMDGCIESGDDEDDEDDED